MADRTNVETVVPSRTEGEAVVGRTSCAHGRRMTLPAHWSLPRADSTGRVDTDPQ